MIIKSNVSLGRGIFLSIKMIKNGNENGHENGHELLVYAMAYAT